MKQFLLNNLKNIYGWKTRRKIIVFSVDDYGNVRLDSKQARKNLDKAGLKVYSRFDAYDSLETKEDLEMLYETLISVSDKDDRNPVFTPYALSCNIDFETMEAENYGRYAYETLPVTFEKLSQKNPIAYKGTYNLWKEGIEKGLMKPQFHGREHLNLKFLQEKLEKKDPEIITSLKNRSYTSISNSNNGAINYTAAFDFWDLKENEIFTGIITDGLKQFENVFGYRAKVFMPPSGKIHESVFDTLKKNGIDYLETTIYQKQHQGNGNYSTSINYPGKKILKNQYTILRNVVFEPTENTSSVEHALNQIKAAFRWNKPAVISSHRVNFCGHIDPRNRETGINALKELLRKIVLKWPDVEFMSADELGDLIKKSSGK